MRLFSQKLKEAPVEQEPMTSSQSVDMDMREVPALKYWLIEKKEDWLVQEYTDEQTGARLVVEQNNPGYPGYPKLTIICSVYRTFILEEVNGAIDRLLDMAGGIPPEQRQAMMLKRIT